MSGGKFTRHIQDMRQRVDVLRGLATHSLIPQDSYPCGAARSDLLTNGGASQALLAEACEKLETALEELQVLEEELSAACEVAEAERQRYEDLFEFAPDAYLVTDGYGMIREANYAAARLLNAAQSFLVGKPLSNFVARSQRRSFRSQLLGLHQRIKPLKHGSSRDKQEWEVHLQPCQERLFDAALTVAAVGNREGKLVALRWLVRDVTERKQAEANLLHQAFHDPLTGLPNRALFLERVGRAIERAKRHKDYLFAVLFLDLDRFKVINDSLGHLAGDQLLKAIAHRLQSLLRSTDTVARLGGDEFTILLEDIKVAWDAAHKATQIQQKLASPLKLLMPTADGNGQEVFVTASIGIVLSNSSYNHPEELLRNADIAMYRAKVLGKARHEIFTTGMHTRVVALLQLQNDLRRALERQEFCLYYQPIVLLETEQLIGFEALLRWQHPNRGLISPVEFIATAEETGLIIPIGYWVLQQACRQMCTWQQHFPAQPPLTISVNLSSKQFAEPELLKQVEEILQQTGLEVST
ncbi:MAG TPA: diguanylate cyclase, partial [Candidatus Caenarcaniphilales bacterium]